MGFSVFASSTGSQVALAFGELRRDPLAFAAGRVPHPVLDWVQSAPHLDFREGA
jgi:hypothetical protein